MRHGAPFHADWLKEREKTNYLNGVLQEHGKPADANETMWSESDAVVYVAMTLDSFCLWDNLELSLTLTDRR